MILWVVHTYHSDLIGPFVVHYQNLLHAKSPFKIIKPELYQKHPSSDTICDVRCSPNMAPQVLPFNNTGTFFQNI